MKDVALSRKLKIKTPNKTTPVICCLFAIYVHAVIITLVGIDNMR